MCCVVDLLHFVEELLALFTHYPNLIDFRIFVQLNGTTASRIAFYLSARGSGDRVLERDYFLVLKAALRKLEASKSR